MPFSVTLIMIIYTFGIAGAIVVYSQKFFFYKTPETGISTDVDRQN